ncbi:putative quinol monooxygenase [Salibacterium salarium]|uniref:putative quinol monooxygenase n=1 Tax=Salibacterium salarium TaxID=284579 RepID=UPI001FE2CDF2|nr:putative quinol monooxygenase [Salibacterium salarium]
MKVKSDVRHTFLDRTKELVKQSQLEEGNISYKLYQDTDNPNAFVMIEEWKDQHSVDYHSRHLISRNLVKSQKSFCKNHRMLLNILQPRNSVSGVLIYFKIFLRLKITSLLRF